MSWGDDTGWATLAQRVPERRAAVSVVIVIDGLRADAVDAESTPNLWALREGGVALEHAHAAVPSVTRANAASISTGTYPGTHGILGSVMYVPSVDPAAVFSTSDVRNLLSLRDQSGEVVLAQSAAERMARSGGQVAAIGSGSSGKSYLLNPGAAKGFGVMISTGDPSLSTPLAFPEAVGEEVLRRFGCPPSKDGVPNLGASTDYMTRVLTEYLLPEVRPDIAYAWFTEPDHTEHAVGAGSPESREALRRTDSGVGRVLEHLEEQGLAANVIVTSDHGFSQLTEGVNVAEDLVAAGLKDALDSTDVVVAVQGCAPIYVRDRDPARIRDIVAFLGERPYAAAIYTPARPPDGGRYARAGGSALESIAEGWVPGTFSHELIHNLQPDRSADILLTLPWTSLPNDHGIPGTSTTASTGTTGPLSGGGSGGPPHSGHGQFSPWDIRIPLIASGPDFKQGVVSSTPCGSVDITPTLLALHGGDCRGLEGRPLVEALRDGPDPLQVPHETRTFVQQRPGGDRRMAVQVCTVGGHRYVDRSWRLE